MTRNMIRQRRGRSFPLPRRAFTQTLFTPYLHLIGVKTSKNGAQKLKTRLSAASIFQKEKSLKHLYNKGFKDSPWTGISSSKIWTATSQALEVGSTPIARSRENIRAVMLTALFCCAECTHIHDPSLDLTFLHHGLCPLNSINPPLLRSYGGQNNFDYAACNL